MNKQISENTNKSEKKIGILTFHFTDNFGASLQLYAHYNFLKKEGYYVDVINYLPSKMLYIVNQSYNLTGFNLKKVLKNALSRKKNSVHLKKHGNFLKNNFNLSKNVYTHKELVELSKGYDLIIVGSDQVWNPLITKEYFKTYLMKGFQCEKMSYAASFGKKLDDKYISDVILELETYSEVSIREKDSCEHLNQYLSSKQATTVLDPVFLISPEQWGEFAIEYNKIEKDYIVIYMLEYNDVMLKTAKLYAKENGYNIYTIETRNFRLYKGKYNFKKLHDLGPQEFVWVIRNSKAVFTNSFHATSFSLLFHKNLFSFSHSSLNLRMSNILSLYNIEELQLDKVVDNNELNRIIKEEKKQYNKKNINLDKAIEKSKEFLKEGIKENGQKQSQ